MSGSRAQLRLNRLPGTRTIAAALRTACATHDALMITPTCTKCGRVIPSDDINVANDVAYCRECNLSHKLSDLTHGAEADESRVDPNNPPRGTWFHREGGGAVIGASHRSVAGAFGTLAVALFWNGIVSIFVLIAIASTLRQMDIPVPHWFPAPDMNGSPMGLGMTIFLWIFLTPFIVIGAGMIAAFLACLGGRTEIRVSEREGVIFTGIGPLGWRRRFDPSQVKQVRIDSKQWRDSDGDSRRKTAVVLEMQSGKQMKLASGLNQERQRFLAGALRQALVKKEIW